jgi:uncharacterized protein (DUF305 family)
MQHAMHEKKNANGHYTRLLLMTLLSFASMYILMYAMVNAFGNVYNSLNQLYMAGLMVAPMIIIELLLMGSMYTNKKRNLILLIVGAIAMAGFWLLIRQQSGITDTQFVRSMIPHHAGAILMCKENKLKDPDLQQLCRNIIASQQAEIDLMKSKLD